MFRRRLAEGKESLQKAFMKKPIVDAIILDCSAESMARKGIQINLTDPSF
jgi:hypothetical protein